MFLLLLKRRRVSNTFYFKRQRLQKFTLLFAVQNFNQFLCTSRQDQKRKKKKKKPMFSPH